MLTPPSTQAKIGPDTKLKCYHCGEPCEETVLTLQDKNFCCAGCKTVYELLEENNLCSYYQMNEKPGSSLSRTFDNNKYSWLDDEDAMKKLVHFTDGKVSMVSFYIPSVHCSSCIFLLENIYKLHPGIVSTKVNFLRKEATITFSPSEISLRQVVELLSKIGYDPQLNLSDLEKKTTSNYNTQYYLKIGVAFFCFGNIMLLSFPEYLGIGALSETPMRKFFGYANFLLALPVLLYSAREFFVSAFTAIRQRSLNMDIPIVLGMIAMFLRSSYEIFLHHGGGYMDTLASLTLLMLIGRLFQNKTYETLSFERDYKSYFPVSVNVKKDDTEQSIPLSKLNVGDKIVVRNQELMPADAILIRGEAMIDYSFVTGESNAIPRHSGEVIYAGGKQIGSAIEAEIVKSVSHSYLTQLWNDAAFKKSDKEQLTTMATKVSRWFTPLVIGIATAAALFWWNTDMEKAINAFTSVLIITCPCALALSSPFTLGNVIRIIARHGIYLKNGQVIEKMAGITSMVFDKTGTLTDGKQAEINYAGQALSDDDITLIKSLTYHSSHPLSKKLFGSLKSEKTIATRDFIEVEGKGVEGWIDGHYVKAGSRSFAGGQADQNTMSSTSSKVHISIDNNYKGYYEIRNAYRKGFDDLIHALAQKFSLYILSGDNDAEKKYLQNYIPTENLVFHQQPSDKLHFIKKLQQEEHKKVMMIGDGLNDAGALRQSDVGLAIADDANNFSPACDGIIDAAQFEKLDQLMQYSKAAVRIIIASFGISLLYNAFGIYLAVQGTMSPLVAAILMPISSVTIISFTSLASYLYGRAIGFK